MRIIAGSKRGLRLQPPSKSLSRPILDRVKESLFNVLRQYDLPGGAHVADLFAGVGSLGLEALSRGAAWVTFVERDPDIQRILRQNITRAGFTDQSWVSAASAYGVGAAAASDRACYDLVFVDPPYPTTEDVGPDSRLAGLFAGLQSQVVAEAVVVVRTSKRTKLMDAYGLFTVFDRRQWGTMAVTLLRYRGADTEDESE